MKVRLVGCCGFYRLRGRGLGVDSRERHRRPRREQQSPTTRHIAIQSRIRGILLPAPKQPSQRVPRSVNLLRESTSHLQHFTHNPPSSDHDGCRDELGMAFHKIQTRKATNSLTLAHSRLRSSASSRFPPMCVHTRRTPASPTPGPLRRRVRQGTRAHQADIQATGVQQRVGERRVLRAPQDGAMERDDHCTLKRAGGAHAHQHPPHQHPPQAPC